MPKRNKISKLLRKIFFTKPKDPMILEFYSNLKTNENNNNMYFIAKSIQDVIEDFKNYTPSHLAGANYYEELFSNKSEVYLSDITWDMIKSKDSRLFARQLTIEEAREADLENIHEKYVKIKYGRSNLERIYPIDRFDYEIG